MEINTVRIALNQLQIGMVSSENIYSTSGLLLISKNTPITQTHLFRLKLYQIFYVSIYNDHSQSINTIMEQDQIIHPYEQDQDFLSFKKQYIKTLSELNVLLHSLIHGKEVGDEIYSCCSKILSVVSDSNMLFHYLYSWESASEKEAILAHCLNVGLYCCAFGTWLDLNEHELKELTLAGLLHDLGKFEIADTIINKPGKLTEEEFEEIKQHPFIGYEKIKDSKLPYSTKMSILQHHEKIDGSGYPFGFQNKEIHNYAKIVAIVDIYDALTSDRTYHKRISPFAVLHILEKDGYNMLDSAYLSIFLKHIASLYKDRLILLSNGETGKIVSINHNLPSRPLVQVGSKIYNLEFELDLIIVDII